MLEDWIDRTEIEDANFACKEIPCRLCSQKITITRLGPQNGAMLKEIPGTRKAHGICLECAQDITVSMKKPSEPYHAAGSPKEQARQFLMDLMIGAVQGDMMTLQVRLNAAAVLLGEKSDAQSQPS